MSRDPFRIDGPAVIAFSGGRTSGYMLHRILQAWDGVLPFDVVPVFCNTGKEHNATLDFVRDCGERWGVPIRWIEYRAAPEPSNRWAEVDYATASRDGEPFSALIKSKGYLPNPLTRFCTMEMKIQASQRFVKSALGFSFHDRAVGLRYDEPKRVASGRRREESGKDGWSLSFPLYDDRVTVTDVVSFWKAQPFDLRLPLLPNGVTPAGNCDLCFLKSPSKISSLIHAEPWRANWWAAQELITGQPFRIDRPAYAQILKQGNLSFYAEDAIDCACTD